jgi:hypothetical protein
MATDARWRDAVSDQNKNEAGPESARKMQTCFGCRFFSITHDARRPYACASFGFRSRSLPSQEVFLSSGQPCLRRVQAAMPNRPSGG